MLKLVRNLLQQIINDIDAGNSNISYEQELQIVHLLQNINDKDGDRMSKSSACDYLGICRASFDNYVKQGFIPKGEKSQGFHELSWHKYDLDKYLDSRIGGQ